MQHADGLLHVGDGDVLGGRVLVLRADADDGHLDAVVGVNPGIGETGSDARERKPEALDRDQMAIRPGAERL